MEEVKDYDEDSAFRHVLACARRRSVSAAELHRMKE